MQLDECLEVRTNLYRIGMDANSGTALFEEFARVPPNLIAHFLAQATQVILEVRR
jgi:hypothetical protein